MITLPSSPDLLAALEANMVAFWVSYGRVDGCLSGEAADLVGPSRASDIRTGMALQASSMDHPNYREFGFQHVCTSRFFLQAAPQKT